MPKVLILSSTPDGDHISVVLNHLDELGCKAKVLLINEFTDKKLPTFHLHKTIKEFCNAGNLAVWYRKPWYLDERNIQSSEVRRHIQSEHREFTRSLCEMVAFYAPEAYWLNNYTRLFARTTKPTQLMLAQKVGMRVPDTLISANFEEISHFAKTHNKVIYKMLANEHMQVGYNQSKEFPSALLDNQTLAKLETAYMPPMIVQEYIDSAHELRITIVGERLFAAKMTPTEQLDTDWRAEYGSGKLKYEAAQLDETISRQLLALMKTLKLDFGCIDIAVDNKDDHFFLEINANGQWLWVEDRLKLGIPKAIAEQLAGTNSKR